jgi:hypothetical protein
MNLIPLFDPSAYSRREVFADKLKAEFNVDLDREDGSWIPQDSCGGYQWNAHTAKWELR